MAEVLVAEVLVAEVLVAEWEATAPLVRRAAQALRQLAAGDYRPRPSRRGLG